LPRHAAEDGRDIKREDARNLSSGALGADPLALLPGHGEETDYFLLLGLWPAGVLPDENGEGVAPPFLRFLSAFGFFFSLLLRI